MSNNVKDINIKNHSYCFFDDIANIKHFDPNNVKIDGKVIQKYSDILHCICNYQRFKIHKS